MLSFLRSKQLIAPTPGDGLFQFRLVSARDAAAANLSSPTDAEECQHPEALQPAKVLGSIVICSFLQGFLNGTSTVTAILDTANTLGFLGFVLVASALYGDFIAQPLPFPIPGIMIPCVTDAKALWEYYENQTSWDVKGEILGNHASAAIKKGRVPTFAGSKQAPVVARFSSRGPDILDWELHPADVLKPDILAPGRQIWAAWSPISSADPILSGRHFALLSGTSMAAPHVGGVAALIKQLHPSWTPSMIASALSTTANKHSNAGRPIMAEGAELYSVHPATPFDYGAGFINPAKALDPGLVLPAEFGDYMGFLCSLPNLTPGVVRAATGAACKASPASPTNLNLPSITISNLRGSPSVRRVVKNIADKSETYTCSVISPEGVEVTVQPPSFNLAPQGTQNLEIRLNVTRASNTFSFGEIVLTGSFDHIVRLTLAVLPTAVI
uniref:Subtilisin-like protease SBT2.4 n=1 Tax=Ananas comosus var. bracteatus TaxID=296719 RepID=A0A6V7QKY6_ANACO|nr:unnamed protein product [Ananas comosus var. bracteatus]